MQDHNPSPSDTPQEIPIHQASQEPPHKEDSQPPLSSEKCPRKCCKRWGMAFFILLPLGALFYGYHLSSQVKKLEEQFHHLQQKDDQNRDDLKKMHEKMGDQGKPGEVVNQLLGTLQNRLANLEQAPQNQLADKVAPTLLYLNKTIEEDGRLIPSLLERLKSQVPSSFKEDVENLKTFFDTFTAPRGHLKAHMTTLLQTQTPSAGEKPASTEPKDLSLMDKIKHFFGDLVHVKKIAHHTYGDLLKQVHLNDLEQIASLLEKHEKDIPSSFAEWVKHFKTYAQAKQKLAQFEQKLFESLN